MTKTETLTWHRHKYWGWRLSWYDPPPPRGSSSLPDGGKKRGIEYLKFKAACETSVKQNTSLGLSKVQHQFQMIRVKYELINSGGKVFLLG